MDETTQAPTEPPLFAPPAAVENVVVEGATATKPWWLSEAPRPRKKKPWPHSANASPHRVKMAHECMAKWHARYRDKRPDPSGPEAIVGKLYHGTAEDAGARRLMRDRRGLSGTASVDELLHLLEFQPAQLAAEKDDSAGRITAAMLEEARGIVKSGGPLDFKNLHAVELTWTLTVEQSFVPGGRIDRIDTLGDPEDPSEVVVYDYKTSQELPDGEDLFFDPQAGLYLAWAHRRWPRARTLRFVIWNPRLGEATKPLRWSKGLDQFALSHARAAWHLWNSGDSTAATGSHCKWCPYRDGDAKWKPCREYQDELEKTRVAAAAPNPHGLASLELPQLLRVYRGSAVAAELHEAQRLAARTVILAKLGKLRSFKAAGLTASVSQDRARSFENLDQLFRELSKASGVPEPELLRDLVDVRRGRLDTWIEALPDERRGVVETILEQFQTLSLKAQKLTVRRSQAMF